MTVPRCAVCRSPQRALADSMIHAGKPHAQVAVAIGVGRHSVQRHVASMHVGPQSPSAPSSAPPPLAAGASAYDVMRRTVDDLIAIDASGMPPAAKSAHYDSLRRAAETLAKLTPVDPAASVIDPLNVPGVQDVLATMASLFGDMASDRLRVPEGADAATVERIRGRAMEREDMRRKFNELMKRLGTVPEAGEAV